MLPRYLHLDLPKHVMKNVSRFCLQAHTLAVESSIWRGGSGHCDKCPCAAVQNEVHVLFHCQDLFVCSLRRKCTFLFFPFCQSFSMLPLIFLKNGGGAPEMEVEYSPSQTIGSRFEPHRRPLPAKLPSFGGYSHETSPHLCCPLYSSNKLQTVEQAAGHLRRKVNYPPSQPVGSEFEPHWRPQSAKLSSISGYSLETLPYLIFLMPWLVRLS